MLFWIVAGWRTWEGHCSLWGIQPSATRGREDCACKKGQTREGDGGTWQGDQSCAVGKVDEVEGQRHGGQWSLTAKALNFYFTLPT